MASIGINTATQYTNLRGGFNPASIVDGSGNKLLKQLLLSKTAMSGSTVFDERSNKGDARAVQLGRALSFNGSNQYAVTGVNVPAFRSISMWLNPQSSTGYRRLFSYGTNQFSAYLDTGAYNLVVKPSGGTNSTGYTVAASAWTHLVIQIALSGNVEVYANGVSVYNSSSSGYTATLNPLYLGALDPSIQLWNGYMFGVKTFANPLSPTDVTALYNFAPTSVVEQTFYKMDENVTGSTVYDSSGNGLHATPINSPTYTTQNFISYQNDVGYTLSGSTFIPRNEAVPTQDVLGGALQFSGEVPYDGLLKQSNCLTFNGTSQYATLGAGLTIFNNSTNAFTIKVRVKPSSVSGVRRFVAQQLGSGSFKGVSLYSNGTSLRFDILNVVGSDQLTAIADALTLAVSTVYDIELIYNGSKNASGVTFRVNGVTYSTISTINSLSSTDVSSGTNFNIGRDSVSNYCAGDVWGVEVINNTTGLHEAHYPIASGYSSIVYDVSGNARHMTTLNSPTWAKQDNYHYNIKNGFSLKNNLFTYSEQFDNSYWTKARCVVVPNSTLSPIGDMTADLIREDTTASNTHYIRTGGAPITLGNNTLFSCYMKANSRDFAALSFNFSGGARQVIFNLLTGETTSIGVDITASGAVDAGNGWWRCWIYQASLGNVLCDIMCALNGTTTAYTGDGTSGVYVWGAQVSNNNFLSAYTKTDGAFFDNLRVPAVSSTLDAEGNALINPAGIFHNKAETQIDFTGGVASPVAVQGSWESAWVFNLARTNPLFKRTLTRDWDFRADRFLAYSTALSGGNLTKVQNFIATKEI